MIKWTNYYQNYPPKKRYCNSTIDKNCIIFWIDFNQEKQILHDHWSHGRIFLHL